MIKNYWKQLLVITYIAIVLALSATAKASSQPYSDQELDDLEQRLNKVIEEHKVKPRNLQSDFNFNPDLALLIISFEDVGYFTFEQILGSTDQRVLFISSESDNIFYVNLSEEIKASLELDKMYLIKGFKQSNSDTNTTNSRPPNNIKDYNFELNKFLDSIFVTGVEIQR